MVRFRFYIYDRNLQRQFCVLLSVSFQEVYDGDLCIICNVNFDHLVKMVLVSFLHCRIAVFPFVIINSWRHGLTLL